MERVQQIPVEDLHPSPFNPRKHLGDLSELVASIRQVGIMQPGTVRPRAAGGFEVVFGHRRSAAGQQAGLTTIPNIVRDLTDDEVLELQIIENSQRADVHPLDEADGFKVLIDRGRSAAQIADKVGRSAAYVAQRLALCQLPKAGRKALEDGRITLGGALVLARVPESLQRKALDELAPSWQRHPIGAKEAREKIERDFMLRLKDAPFAVDDAELVPAAGPCTSCPKRTGTQVDLFADASSPNLCTDPVCFRGKLDACFQIRAKEAAEKGLEVLVGKKAEKALEYSSGFVRVDADHWTGGKSVKVATVAKAEGLAVTVVQDPRTRAPVELVSRREVEKAANKGKKPDRFDERTQGLASKARAASRKRERVVALVTAAGAQQARKARPADLVLLLARLLVMRAGADELAAMAERRTGKKSKRGSRGTLEIEGKSHESILASLLEEAKTTADVNAFAAELALQMLAPSTYAAARWGFAAKGLGINLGKLEKQAGEELRAEAKAKKAGKAKASKARKRKAGAA